MGISIFNIKKWYRMVTGKSVLHVNQDMGKCFVPGEVKGYFNNLTEKVTKEPELLENDSLPLLITEKGEKVSFPVGIFQYGLGAYDLYLETSEEKYLVKFKQSVDWCFVHQLENGAWDNFSFLYPEHPYGAMCQGEAASLLIRGYIQTKEPKYLDAAAKALDFMLKPIENGGTSKYEGDDLILMEYTHLPAVLNGWIFAAFGLYDMSLISNRPAYEEAFRRTVGTIKRRLPRFDNGYWTKYDDNKKIASPFYHNLHIAELQGLYLATEDKIFKEFADKWRIYQSKWWNKRKAFIKKAWQKVKE